MLRSLSQSQGQKHRAGTGTRAVAVDSAPRIPLLTESGRGTDMYRNLAIAISAAAALAACVSDQTYQAEVKKSAT